MSKTAIFTATQALGSGSLTHDVVIGTDTPNVEGSYKLNRAALKAASAISQAVSVTKIPVAGSSYPGLLDTSTLSSATTYDFRPAAGSVTLRRGDTIRLTCANSGTPAISVFSTIELERID